LTIYAELHRAVAVQIRDLSVDGCLLVTRAFLQVGTVGVLDLELEGERRAEWFRTCRVQALQGRSGTYLVAAEFLPVAAARDQSLRDAVRQMRLVEHRHVSGLPGCLSGDPGKSSRASADVGRGPGARSTDLPRQMKSADAAALAADGGRPIADLAGVDAPESRESNEGGVYMKRQIIRLVRDDEGQDLIEYVLIGSFVSIGALVGATALGVNLNGWYNAVAAWVTGATGQVPAAP
jgi:Flp pilus assembly pilin Flp